LTAGACQRDASAGARKAFSPRVHVAIRSEAASRIASVNVAVTITTGAFIDTQSRCTSPRLVVRGVAREPLAGIAKGFGKMALEK
jgi:hypothetical protein